MRGKWIFGTAFLLSLFGNYWLWHILSLNFSMDFFGENPRLVFQLSQEEISTINTRRSYYAIKQFSWLENKPVYWLEKWQKNFFESLDLNYYFFAGHPRERLEVAEYSKFPFIYLPILALGLWKIVEKKQIFLLLYPAILIALLAFLQNIGESLFVLFPWFAVVLTEGFKMVFGYVKN